MVGCNTDEDAEEEDDEDDTAKGKVEVADDLGCNSPTTTVVVVLVVETGPRSPSFAAAVSV